MGGDHIIDNHEWQPSKVYNNGGGAHSANTEMKVAIFFMQHTWRTGVAVSLDRVQPPNFFLTNLQGEGHCTSQVPPEGCISW